MRRAVRGQAGSIAGEQRAERVRLGQAEEFALRPRLQVPASGEKSGFLPEAPRLVLASRRERQAPGKSPRAAAPGGQKKVSRAAARAELPALQFQEQGPLQAVVSAPAEAQTSVLAAPSPFVEEVWVAAEFPLSPEAAVPVWMVQQ